MKETISQLNARTKAENRLFMKMPKWRRRVTIARDVLAQLAAQRFNPITGRYFIADSLSSLSWQDDLQNTQLQKQLKTVEKCDVCALGSMFVCGVQRANSLTIGESMIDGDGEIGGTVAYEYLERFFEKRQLQLIESAFEQRNMDESSPWLGESAPEDWQEDYESEDIKEAIAFAKRIPDSRERLRLIMENIVVNRGHFNPQLRPQTVTNYVTPGFKG
jgi:hypothetical protein